MNHKLSDCSASMTSTHPASPLRRRGVVTVCRKYCQWLRLQTEGRWQLRGAFRHVRVSSAYPVCSQHHSAFACLDPGADSCRALLQLAGKVTGDCELMPYTTQMPKCHAFRLVGLANILVCGQVEEGALSKEKDKVAQERLDDVRKELGEIPDLLLRRTLYCAPG